MREYHLSHLPEVQAAIAAAEGCSTISELHEAAERFDATSHARDNPARTGGPGPLCTSGRPVMFVGKSPATTESGTGIPFSGPAGLVLRDALAGMGYELDAAWLTCATFWRAKDNLPKATQLAWSRPFLHRQIELVRPSVIIALGEKSNEGITQEKGPILPKIGTWTTFRAGDEDIPVLRTMCHAFVMYGLHERMPVFRKHIAMAAEAHPEAFAALRVATAAAA